jgi:hypothetical protein
MTLIETRYYFSGVAMTFASILILVLIGLFSTSLFFAITDGFSGAILISILLGAFLIISFPKYYKFISSFISRRPALILTPTCLIDNINEQEYKWSDIKTIAYERHQGKTPGGHTAVTLEDPEKYINADSNSFGRLIKRLNTNHFGGTFSIPHNSIKCKSADLIDELRRFHASYK